MRSGPWHGSIFRDLALNLGNIVERVAQLPLDDSGIALLASEPAAEQARVEGWRGVLAAMWADLIGVIDIKQLNTPDAVLFDPDARQALYQNLRLDLASARLAVLRRDTDNLRVSLRLVNNLLSNYFDLDDQGVASVIETLEGMSADRVGTGAARYRRLVGIPAAADGQQTRLASDINCVSGLINAIFSTAVARIGGHGAVCQSVCG